MTKEQKQRYEAHMADYGARIDITPGVRSLIFSLACIELEEEQLQKEVDKHGTVYETSSGIIKQRPEWQQLRDDRQRKTAIVGKLEGRMSLEPIEHDPLAALHAQLD